MRRDAELLEQSACGVQLEEMQRAVGRHARDDVCCRSAAAHRREHCERWIRHLEAELDLGALLRKRFGAAEIERVELPRLLAERKKRAFENEGRGVRHPLRRRRLARVLVAWNRIAASPQLTRIERPSGRNGCCPAGTFFVDPRGSSGCSCRRSRSARSRPSASSGPARRPAGRPRPRA